MTRIDVSQLTPAERRAFERSIDRELSSLPDAGPAPYQEDVLRSQILAAEYEAEKGHRPTEPANWEAWLRQRHEREEESVELEESQPGRAELEREHIEARADAHVTAWLGPER